MLLARRDGEHGYIHIGWVLRWADRSSGSVIGISHRESVSWDNLYFHSSRVCYWVWPIVHLSPPPSSSSQRGPLLSVRMLRVLFLQKIAILIYRSLNQWWWLVWSLFYRDFWAKRVERWHKMSGNRWWAMYIYDLEGYLMICDSKNCSWK